MQIAIVGIRGLPNNYGGFETLAEYLVEYLAKDFEITVFCSSKDMDSRLTEFKGAKLSYVPVSSHGLSGMLYDSISLYKAVKKFDKIIFLGFGAGFLMPLIKRHRNKMILNFGGLDWKRDKWSKYAQWVIKKSESLLVNNSRQLVADNVGIQLYIKEEYGRDSTLIAYGGDQANFRVKTPEMKQQYTFLEKEYAFIVTRIQSDNNIEMILQAFMEQDLLSLVMVGNWNNSPYGIKIKSEYTGKKNLILLDAIYEREKLDVLRSNCTLYIHGHSAGGTNPSLAEAMYLGLPVFAYASGYNEYTSGNKAKYFKNKQDLVDLLNNYQSIDLEKMGSDLKEIAQKKYRWSAIADAYKKLIEN